MSSQHTLTPLAKSLRPIMEVFIPALKERTIQDIDAILERVDEKLFTQPSSLRIQLRLFVKALHYLPLVRYGRTFKHLNEEQKVAFLKFLQDCPVQKLRVGLWGLRTLIYLGYYGDPVVQNQLGYHPDLRGWEAPPYAHP